MTLQQQYSTATGQNTQRLLWAWPAAGVWLGLPQACGINFSFQPTWFAVQVTLPAQCVSNTLTSGHGKPVGDVLQHCYIHSGMTHSPAAMQTGNYDQIMTS
jgi:hypothetical protein